MNELPDDTPTEADPNKACMYRFSHREIPGEQRGLSRICPACWPESE